MEKFDIFIIKLKECKLRLKCDTYESLLDMNPFIHSVRRVCLKTS